MESVKKEYYLCGQAVIDQFKPEEVSKPIYWLGMATYIAVIDFTAVEKHYNENKKNIDSSFWCREVEPGSMETEKIELEDIKAKNFYIVICDVLSLSTETNIARCVYNIANAENLTPIELFNLLNAEYEKNNN